MAGSSRIDPASETCITRQSSPFAPAVPCYARHTCVVRHGLAGSARLSSYACPARRDQPAGRPHRVPSGCRRWDPPGGASRPRGRPHPLSGAAVKPRRRRVPSPGTTTSLPFGRYWRSSPLVFSFNPPPPTARAHRRSRPERRLGSRTALSAAAHATWYRVSASAADATGSVLTRTRVRQLQHAQRGTVLERCRASRTGSGARPASTTCRAVGLGHQQVALPSGRARRGPRPRSPARSSSTMSCSRATPLAAVPALRACARVRRPRVWSRPDSTRDCAQRLMVVVTDPVPRISRITTS